MPSSRLPLSPCSSSYRCSPHRSPISRPMQPRSVLSLSSMLVGRVFAAVFAIATARAFSPPAPHPLPARVVVPLYHFGLPTVFTEWAHLAQDRVGWQKLVTTPPFAIGKPFVRQPRGDIRVTPEDKRRAVAQRAAEIAERRAVFDANNNN